MQLVPLPNYDVRVKRELAHRRLVVSMLRRTLRWTTLLALDAVAVAVSVGISGWLAGVEGIQSSVIALTAFVLVGLNVRGSYGPGPARRDSQHLVQGVLIGTLLAAIPATLPPPGLPLSFILLFGLTTSAALIVARQSVDALLHLAYARGIGLRKAVVVCRTGEADSVLMGLRSSPSDHSKDRPDDQLIIGYLSCDMESDGNALGSLSRLRDVLETHDVAELVIASALRDDSVTDVAEVCFERGVQVFVIPNVAPRLNAWAELTRVGRWPAYHLHPTRLELPSLFLKRAFDLGLAALGVMVCAPLLLVIAAAIKIETRGPVFFRQRRVGLAGREFMIWKFRSMANDSEARLAEVAHLNSYGDAKLFKLASDPRITRVGALLRRFSLDELPQLLNVLRGEMALVGPRPPLPSEVLLYEPRHFVRLSVMPGMTGPWQVSGRNLITDFEEVVRLERDYIERWSLRSDVEIMLRTLRVVLSGRGAY